MLPPELTEHVIFKSAPCSIFTDVTHFPLMINRIVGKPSAESFKSYIGRVNAVLDAARSQRLKVVIINDFSDSQPPDATVRKLFVEGAEQVGLKHKDTLLCWVPIVTNPLIRGVMTALSWMFSDSSNVPMEYGNSLSAGLTKALSIWTSNNLTPPNVDPNQYTFPEG